MNKSDLEKIKIRALDTDRRIGKWSIRELLDMGEKGQVFSWILDKLVNYLGLKSGEEIQEENILRGLDLLSELKISITAPTSLEKIATTLIKTESSATPNPIIPILENDFPASMPFDEDEEDSVPDFLKRT